jgi:tartrate dehydrogenase/decarboxylase / D-malate dehydrogenase
MTVKENISRRRSIAVVAGDGIGTEVVPAAMSVVDAAAARHGVAIDWTPYPWGLSTNARTGR